MDNPGFYTESVARARELFFKNNQGSGNEVYDYFFKLIVENTPAFGRVLDLGTGDGFEREFGLSRQSYLEFAWDMDPSKYIKKDPQLSAMFYRLSRKYDLFVLSDAPEIWISKVLSYLEIENLFKKVFSGGNLGIRKKSGLYELALKSLDLDAKNCFMIGDEKATDVDIPRALGIKSIHLTREKDILKIEDILVGLI